MQSHIVGFLCVVLLRSEKKGHHAETMFDRPPLAFMSCQYLLNAGVTTLMCQDNTFTDATTHCSNYLHTCYLAGRLQHYINTGKHMKGQPVHSVIASGPGPGIQHCSLEIVEVQTVSLFGAAAAEWGPHAYESLLELHTGRTHQVHSSCLYRCSGIGQMCGCKFAAEQQYACPCLFQNSKLSGKCCQQCCVVHK